MGHHPGVIDSPAQRLDSKHLDPVCGMTVDPEHAGVFRTFGGVKVNEVRADSAARRVDGEVESRYDRTSDV